MKEIKSEPLGQTEIRREIKQEPVDDDYYSIRNSKLLVPKLEEPDDFEYPDFMKVEPNPEEEFSDLLVPERDQSSSRPPLVKLEPEPLNEYDFSDLLVPETEEPNHLDRPSITEAPLVPQEMSNIKSEPVDLIRLEPQLGARHDPLSIAAPSKLLEPKPEEMDFWDLLVSEEEPSTSLDKVKLEPKLVSDQSQYYPCLVKLEPEPLDEDDISELLEPETDRLDRPSSPTGPYHYEEHTESTSSDRFTLSLERTMPTTNCGVCNKRASRGEMSETVVTDRKIIFLLSSVLSGWKTIKQAKQWLPCQFWYCKAHIPAVVETIFNALEIENIYDMESCSIDNRKKVMTILNGLDEKLDFDAFEQILSVFMVKMDLLGSEDRGNDGRQPIRRRCGVCSVRKNFSRMPLVVRSNNRKLILMVGSVLSKKKTVKEAKRAISQKIPVCKSHFSETISQIFEAMNIKNICEMTLSLSYKQNVLPIVHALRPNCNFIQFYNALKDFCQRIGEI